MYITDRVQKCAFDFGLHTEHGFQALLREYQRNTAYGLTIDLRSRRAGVLHKSIGRADKCDSYSTHKEETE